MKNKHLKYVPEADTCPDNVTEWRVVDENHLGTTYVTNYGGSIRITRKGNHIHKRQETGLAPCCHLRIRKHYKRFVSGGGLSHKFVHRVVYQAFHPDEDITGKQVHHLDGNKWNNRIDNLIACTREEHQHYDNSLRRGEVIITNLQKSLFYVIS